MDPSRDSNAIPLDDPKTASSASNNKNMNPKVRVTLTGVSETMLVTLFARAEDASRPRPLLGDPWSARLADQVRMAGYTFHRTLGDRFLHTGVVLRARMLDAWTTEFLRSCEANGQGATVLHLACGVDTRSLRVDWRGPQGNSKKVRWIDVDVAEVVDLRRKLLPSPQGDYRLLTASVTEDKWLETIPADRPTVIVMEGLAMYLEPAEMKRLVARLCARFPTGQIVFDSLGTLSIRLQSLIRPISLTGAVMKFGMNDGKVLESVHSKLRLKSQVGFQGLIEYEEFPLVTRAVLWLLSWIPSLGSILRYEIGGIDAHL